MSRLSELEYLFATEEGDIDKESLIELVLLLQDRVYDLLNGNEDTNLD